MVNPGHIRNSNKTEMQIHTTETVTVYLNVQHGDKASDLVIFSLIL